MGCNSFARTAQRRESGVTVIELLIVIAVIAIMGAIAIPQMIAARRLHRAAGVPREIMTQMRYARQLAMSQKQGVTFRLDFANASNKQIHIIDHNEGVNSATGALLTAVADTTVRTVPLGAGGTLSANIRYGRPTGAPPAAENLADGSRMRAMPGGNVIDVTFRPDGTVRDAATLLPDSFALLMYDRLDPSNTAYAVSVLGAGGRVRMWKYDPRPAPVGRIFVRQ